MTDSPTQLLYAAAGAPPVPGAETTDSARCWLCGGALDGSGVPRRQAVKATFTDHDCARAPESGAFCAACAWIMAERNDALTARTSKDKPQRGRNYSHFVKAGAWYPLSKAQKGDMRTLLLEPPFLELAVIADSGQKHLVFKARANPPGAAAGWVQFEEQTLWIEPAQLAETLELVEALYVAFSKEEIATGAYNHRRVLDFGLEQWRALETEIRPLRKRALFNLALFLAQRSDDDRGTTDDGRRSAGDSVARRAGGLQEQVPDDDLDAVREPGAQRGVHEQPGEVRQLPLL